MKTPWHLWVIGTASLVWNAGGVYDYLMMQMNVESYRVTMSPEQIAWFDALPVWLNLFWALGVWGAILGSILLLMRSRLAALSFSISLIGIIVNISYTVAGGSAVIEMMGTRAMAFSAAIIIVALALWLYARAMLRSGVLR